jgi:hypothetical protein
VADRLCRAGASAVAAELGAHLPDPAAALMHEGHYDDALQFGGHSAEIFEFIRKECPFQATQTMTDGHFASFTDWFKVNGFDDELDVVEKALLDQGRTCEVRRMRNRLARFGGPIVHESK